MDRRAWWATVLNKCLKDLEFFSENAGWLGIVFANLVRFGIYNFMPWGDEVFGKKTSMGIQWGGGMDCSSFKGKKQRGKSDTSLIKKTSPDALCMCLVVSDSDPTDCSPPGTSVHRILLDKNIGVGRHSIPQGIFLTQGLNLVSCIAGRFFTI